MTDMKLEINDKWLIETYDQWIQASIYAGLMGLGVGYAFMKVPTNKLPFDKKYWPYVGTFVFGSTLHFIFMYTALRPGRIAWQIRQRRRNFTSQIPRLNTEYQDVEILKEKLNTLRS